MLRMSMLVSCLAVAVIALSLSGCAEPGDSDQPPAADQPEAGSSDDQGEGDHAGHMPMDPDVAEALAELSPQDRAAAEKQRICPVQEAALGSMGKPVKVSVQGRDVFLCCEGCREDIMNDPDKYLAKLNN